MGAAAELIGVDPGFLRALGRGGLITPHRSGGGHRRYSRNDLDMAARAREVVDEGMTLAAACRIVMLEFQLAQAHDTLTVLRQHLAGGSAATDRAATDGEEADSHDREFAT
jgi:DNA-binding transcriptional MerR regulator